MPSSVRNCAKRVSQVWWPGVVPGAVVAPDCSRFKRARREVAIPQCSNSKPATTAYAPTKTEGTKACHVPPAGGAASTAKPGRSGSTKGASVSADHASGRDTGALGARLHTTGKASSAAKPNWAANTRRAADWWRSAAKTSSRASKTTVLLLTTPITSSTVQGCDIRFMTSAPLVWPCLSGLVTGQSLGR